MAKYIDAAFGTALGRSTDRDLAGRNLAPAHAKLHQLPVHADRSSEPTEYRETVAPEMTDADRMDILRQHGIREALLCKLSKTPGSLSIILTWVTGMIRTQGADKVRLFLSAIVYSPDCFMSLTRRDATMAGAASSEGIVIHDNGRRPIPAIPAKEHSTLTFHDKLEDDPAMPMRPSPDEVYRYLGRMAREGSAAVREANAKGLRHRFGSSRACFDAVASTASAPGPDGCAR